MTEYKRLIKELGQDNSETKYNCENCEFISSDYKEGNKWCDASMCHRAVEKRLAELEDEIESGRWVEFNKPFYSEQFGAWCVYLREGDYIKSACITKEQAEAFVEEYYGG